MKLFTKLTILIWIFLLFSSYSSAGRFWLDVNLQKNIKNKFDTIQESWMKIPCNQKPWFEEKIQNIKNICIQKINLLNKVNGSLKEIIPLVKDQVIKTNLQDRQKNIQTMIENYTTLKLRIKKNPKSICEQPSVWKAYNEQTKLIVEDIKTQFRLLKKQ